MAVRSLLRHTVRRGRDRSLAIVVVALALIGGLVQGQAVEPMDRILAVVNGDLILESDFAAEEIMLRQQYQAAGAQLPPRAQFRDQILERLIMQRLQLAYARGIGMSVDDDTLNQAVREVANRNNLQLPQFQQALEREGIAFSRFREDLRQDILFARLHRRQIERQIDITEADIRAFMASEMADVGTEYRLSRILLMPADGESLAALRERAEATLQALRDGADFAETAGRVSRDSRAQHGGELGWLAADNIPAAVRAALANMQPGDFDGPSEVGEGYQILKLVDVRSAREQFVEQALTSHILIRADGLIDEQAVRQRLSSLRERIVRGESFSSLARAHSEDPGSASRGGDLGWVSSGQMAREFEAVMEATGVGEVSEPFQTRFGWHLLTVVDRRDHDNTADFLRQQAVQQIRERRGDEVLEAWLRRLRDEAFVDVRWLD
jgi:peptidyl-prolyl cis-trans isomerase SurA